MLEIKIIRKTNSICNNHFFFRVVVEGPRTFDRPGFLPAFGGMLKLRLVLEAGEL